MRYTPGAAGTTWQLVFDDRSVPNAGGKYRVQKRAKDAAGNTEVVTGFGFTATG